MHYIGKYNLTRHDLLFTAREEFFRAWYLLLYDVFSKFSLRFYNRYCRNHSTRIYFGKQFHISYYILYIWDKFLIRSSYFTQFFCNLLDLLLCYAHFSVIFLKNEVFQKNYIFKIQKINMTFPKRLPELFSHTEEITLLRYNTAKIVFLLCTTAFFLNYFLLWARFHYEFNLKILPFTYVLFVCSLFLYTFFALQIKLASRVPAAILFLVFIFLGLFFSLFVITFLFDFSTLLW